MASRVTALMFLCLLLAVVQVRAAEAPPPPPLPDAVSGLDPDYQAVRHYQKTLTPDQPALPAGGASREEMALALGEVAARAADGDPNQLKASDYDALYALLQKYRDEIRALGIRQQALEAELAAMKKRQEDMEGKIRGLKDFVLDGLKINGEYYTYYNSLQLLGPGAPFKENPAISGNPGKSAGQDTDYRLLGQDVKLFLQGNRGPVSAESEVEFRYLLGVETGPYWVMAPTWINVESRLPVVVEGGQFHAKLTPLTLWREEDVFADEPEPFSDWRQKQRDDLHVSDDNEANLLGLRLSTDLVLGPQVIHTQALLHVMGYPQSVLYYMRATGTAYAGGPSVTDAGYPYTANAITNGEYGDYLGGWQAETEFFKSLDLGYTGTMMANTTDSNNWTYTASMAPPSASLIGSPVRGFVDQVHSVNLGGDFWGGLLSVQAEGAESLYSDPSDPTLYDNPVTAGTGYLTGTAMTLDVEVKRPWFSLKADVHDVDRSFISAAAQGRDQDSNYDVYGPFVHQNDNYSPDTNNYWSTVANGPAPTANAGLDRYNTVILPPFLEGPVTGSAPHFTQGALEFNYLMPYNAAVNASSPYGLATPNRVGYNLDGDLNLFQGGLKPWAGLEMSHEKAGDALGTGDETYSIARLGAPLDLKALWHWPFTAELSLQDEGIDNPNLSGATFTSLYYSGGLSWNPIESTVFYLGYQHIHYTGTLAYPVTGGYLDPLTDSRINGDFAAIAAGPYAYNQAYDQWGVGLRYHAGAHWILNLCYSVQTFFDALAASQDGANAYTMNQLIANVDVKF